MNLYLLGEWYFCPLISFLFSVQCNFLHHDVLEDEMDGLRTIGPYNKLI